MTCAPDRNALIQALTESGLFDGTWYLQRNGDVAAAGLNPLQHFIHHGSAEGCWPNRYFDPDWYQQESPGLEVNPLLHCILVGGSGNRRPVPYFDPGWYRNEYAVPAGRTALGHYLTNRRKQVYSPTPLFDVQRYVSQTDDGLGSNCDPFAHYLLAGMTRDIDPSGAFDAGGYRHAHLGRPGRGFVTTMRPEEHNPLVHSRRLPTGRATP